MKTQATPVEVIEDYVKKGLRQRNLLIISTVLMSIGFIWIILRIFLLDFNWSNKIWYFEITLSVIFFVIVMMFLFSLENTKDSIIKFLKKYSEEEEIFPRLFRLSENLLSRKRLLGYSIPSVSYVYNAESHNWSRKDLVNFLSILGKSGIVKYLNEDLRKRLIDCVKRLESDNHCYFCGTIDSVKCRSRKCYGAMTIDNEETIGATTRSKKEKYRINKNDLMNITICKDCLSYSVDFLDADDGLPSSELGDVYKFLARNDSIILEFGNHTQKKYRSCIHDQYRDRLSTRSRIDYEKEWSNEIKPVDDFSDDELIAFLKGLWVVSYVGRNMTITNRYDDGTFDGKYLYAISGGYHLRTYSGKWNISNGIVTDTVTNSNFGKKVSCPYVINSKYRPIEIHNDFVIYQSLKYRHTKFKSYRYDLESVLETGIVDTI